MLKVEYAIQDNYATRMIKRELLAKYGSPQALYNAIYDVAHAIADYAGEFEETARRVRDLLTAIDDTPFTELTSDIDHVMCRVVERIAIRHKTSALLDKLEATLADVRELEVLYNVEVDEDWSHEALKRLHERVPTVITPNNECEQPTAA